jgi:hypothetical protein
LPYLSWLEEALAAKLAEQPIGTPVALRAYLQLTSDHGLLVAHAAGMTALAERWFGGKATSVYSQGSVDSGYVSLLVQFAAGETALVVSELVRPARDGAGERPLVKLLVIGNHGTIEFEDAPGSDGLPVVVAPPDGPRERELAREVERSLGSGQPAVAGAG